jgi:hypothetical protein
MKRFKMGIIGALAILTVAFTVATQAGIVKLKKANDCYKASDYAISDCGSQGLPALPNGTLPPYNPASCTYSSLAISGGFDELKTNCTGSTNPCCFTLEPTASCGTAIPKHCFKVTNIWYKD